MQLKPNSFLQGGKYRIIRALGQGGFGITYEAEQPLLRKTVAIKEFFMKDCCEREEATSQVTVGTGSQRALVEKFRGKFIREAQMIAGMNHPHIVRVTDVFEENGTAYYVMEHLPGGSLADIVKQNGPLSEVQAEKYIYQVAEALVYIHAHNTVHLDVKPSNILLNERGEAVLIDFGISKHYDDSGEQTSSTPVGISKGYAPLEQGRDGDVSQFKPSTDIYALGATLYYLVSGNVPPEASVVNEDGLCRPKNLSTRIWNVIETSMQPRRKERPQDISEFLALLDGQTPASNVESEDTVVHRKPELRTEQEVDETHPKSKPWPWILLALAVLILFALPKIKPILTKSISTQPAVSETLSSEVKPDSPPETIAPGSVKVTSTPSGATIWLDGKSTQKTTPDILESLTPGNHSIKLVLEGYNDFSGSVSINSSQRADLSAALIIKEKPGTGKENGHDWVDLGLSVKWATCNIGATSASASGSLFAWGETRAKTNFSWENYKFRISGNDDSPSSLQFSKYHPNIDNKQRLDLSDDAARANWGGKWRMPTKAEFDELKNKCSWTWISQNGTKGYKITGKNGNSIFLPSTLFSEGLEMGFYWSSSVSEDPLAPWFFWIRPTIETTWSDFILYRCSGFSVRPVC